MILSLAKMKLKSILNAKLGGSFDIEGLTDYLVDDVFTTLNQRFGVKMHDILKLFSR